jgi:hypothetical protein
VAGILDGGAVVEGVLLAALAAVVVLVAALAPRLRS